MGAGEGGVTCYRFSKNIFELTHLSGGFLEDKYLYPLSLSISPSCLPVSSLVHEGLERWQKGQTDKWTRSEAWLGHTLSPMLEVLKRAGLEARQWGQFVSDSYELCVCVCG